MCGCWCGWFCIGFICCVMQLLWVSGLALGCVCPIGCLFSCGFPVTCGGFLGGLGVLLVSGVILVARYCGFSWVCVFVVGLV